jgi:uncharacterized protein YecA (UPF0149 family)
MNMKKHRQRTLALRGVPAVQISQLRDTLKRLQEIEGLAKAADQLQVVLAQAETLARDLGVAKLALEEATAGQAEAAYELAKQRAVFIRLVQQYGFGPVDEVERTEQQFRAEYDAEVSAMKSQFPPMADPGGGA